MSSEGSMPSGCDAGLGEESCSKMAAVPKCPPLVAGEGRMSNRLRKKAPVALLFLMAFKLLPASEALPVSAPSAPDQNRFCFVCDDEDRCPNIKNIFRTNGDTWLCELGSNVTIPECSVVPTDVPNCFVCRNKSKINIISSEYNIQVEDGNGLIPVRGYRLWAAADYHPNPQTPNPPSLPSRFILVLGFSFAPCCVLLLIFIGFVVKKRSDAKKGRRPEHY